MLKTGAIAILILSVQCSVKVMGQEIKKSGDPPNVIMFATDDLNNWVNPLGYEQAITPNLDRLAAMGVTFTNAHAPATFCAPSRSAIWSGLHASTTGCYNDELYFVDRPDLVSMQSAFKQAGYKTYGAGKLYHHRAGSYDTRGWDMYFSRSQEIRDKGYEMGYTGSDVPWPDPRPYSPYYNDPNSSRYIPPPGVPDGGGFLEWGPIAPEDAEKIPDAVRTNWVVELLAQEHTDPFFIGLGMYSPHFPNYAPQKFFDLYIRDSIKVPELYDADLDDLPDHIRNRMKNRLGIQANLEKVDAVEDAVMAYLACVSFADAMLGRVLDALEASSYKDNTVVIFWSDQGYHHGEKGQWGKHTLWKETSHVPFIFAGNGLPKNKKVETTVSLIDIYPTLIELCNLPKQHEMDGESLVPTLNNPEGATDRNVLMNYHYRGGYTVINSDWRYIQYHDGSEELYDLADDPNEYFNLANNLEYRDTINMMKQSAPAEFEEEGTPRSALKLIIKDDSFYWEFKPVSRTSSITSCSITFTDPIRQQGLSFEEIIYRDSVGFSEQLQKGGKECRHIPADSYCFFDADNQYISSPDNALNFHITYFDEGNGSFELQYNTAESAAKSILINKTNTNQWVTKTLMVGDAALNNQLDYQADFRISGEVHIHSVIIDRPIPTDISVVFSDQIYEKGMGFLVGTDPTRETWTEKKSIGGQICRYIPWGDKRKYGYFRVDDALIKPGDRELTFDVTYYDLGTSNLSIQYNSLEGTNPNYLRVDIPRTNTKTWMTKSISVSDASLRNLQNNQSDFRIMGEAYVQRVALRKGIVDPEVPEIPVVFVVPQEPADPTGILQYKQSEHDIRLGFDHEMLRIVVPEELINAELTIYNLLGQTVFQSQIDQSEKTFQLMVDPGLYIVLLEHSSTRIGKKININH